MMNTNLLVALISSFFAVYFGGITLNAPKQFLFLGGIVGIICWVVYVQVYQISNNAIASFVSSLGVAIASNIFARVYKAPVTMFFIPGFLPIVPGIAVYRMVYFYITNQRDKGYANLVSTIETAVMIAMAIVIVDSLFKSIKKGMQLYQKKFNQQ